MKNLIFSVALILGSINSITAQDIYLPVSSTSETAKSDYFKALQAGENSNIAAFFDGLKSGVKTDPNFFMAYAYLSLAQTSFGQYEEAAAAIKPALAIDAAGFNEGEQILRKALQALDKNPKADVATFMTSLTAAYPQKAQAHDLASICATWISKDPSAAIQHSLRVLELRPEYGGGYNSLGYSYMALKQMDKAKAAFEKYIALAPKESNAYDSMAEYYMVNKDYAKSAEYYDKAAEMGGAGAKERADKAREEMKKN